MNEKKKILIGDNYLCLKDYRMDDGTIAYRKGVLYECITKGCLADNFGDIYHNMEPINSQFNKHFKYVTKDYIVHCVNSFEEREALLKELAAELNNAYSALLGLPKTEITDRIMSRLLPLINKSKQHTS